MRMSRHLGLWGRSSGTVEPELVTVTIIGYGLTDLCYVTILGTKHVDPVTLEIPSGTELEAYSSGVYRGTILVDGQTVSAGKPASHTMAVDRALNVQFTADNTMYTGIEITSA